MGRKIISNLIRTLVFFYDSCVFSVKKGCADAVLIIRLDAIGDFILWLDSAQHFKKLHPDKKIILLGNKAWSDFAKKIPYWDEVWPLDRQKFNRNPLYRFDLLRKVRKAGFESVIQPTYSREFLYGDSIVRVSGAREKVGSIRDYNNVYPLAKKISDRFYTQLIPANPKPLMELRRNAEFMRGLGLRVKAGLPDLSFALKGVANPLSDVTDYYVMVPGAGWSGRQWPITRFAALADKIYRQAGLTAVVCGSPAEQGLSATLISKIDAPVVDMTGKTNLVELAVIIKAASFLVGNETSAVHVAAAVDTPVVCILGGGHYRRFVPYELEVETGRPLPMAVIHRMNCYGCNWRCTYMKNPQKSPVPCIAKISVEKVWQEVLKILPE